jgi:hypothetical protein
MIGWISPVPVGATFSGGTRKLWDLSQILVDHGFASVVIPYADLRSGAPGIAWTERTLVVVPEVYDTEIATIVPPGVRRVAFVQNGYLLNATEPVHPYDTCPDLVAILTSCDNDTRLVRERCPRFAGPIIRTHSSGNGRLGKPGPFSYGPWPRERRVLYFEYKNGPGSWTGGDLLGPLFGSLDLPAGWELVLLSGRSDEQIAGLMRTSALFVAPLRKEGMCAPTSEAMITGCVIVGWDGGGAAEYLRSRAMLAEQDNVDDLRGLVRACADAVDHDLVDWGPTTEVWSNWFQNMYSRDREVMEIVNIAHRLGA